MSNNPNESTPQIHSANTVLWDGLGIGVFALIAGALLLAEQIGWISKEIKWGVPAVLLAFGLVTIARAFKRK